MHLPRLAAALVVALLMAAAPAWAAHFKPLEIVSQNGVHVFSVEIADTPAERERGLMYRKHLPASEGMLFDFDSEQNVAMWMKNTFIPLDMLFIGGNGRISHIAADTKPLSTDIISSDGPVRAVLEVAGGTCARLGIKPGDRVAFSIFNRH